ncbi:MAG: YbaK/EbsC family protein [Chlorobi bacterium]|nr:YbaK/EbsC family protein [Chlorobiota bacterium]
MPVQKLKDFLDSNNIEYVTIRHSPAYTAQKIAHSAHVSGKELAKTVMVKIDGVMSMAVLPAPYKVDLEALREASGGETISLATEEEFRDLFPGCDLGAMPPFGNLYGMDVYAAEKLAKDEDIVFNAGSHWELIRMKYRDFERLVKPKLVKFAELQ